MEICYKREMNHNYMVVSPDWDGADGYESRMLLSNSVEGTLKFRLKRTDNRPLFYYEITSRQPLKRMMEKRYVKPDEIRQILIQIAAVQKRLENYLLPENRILLDPEYIYVELDTFSVNLCVIPAYEGDFSKNFSELLQYLMEKIDHQDKDSVILAYRLYHESLKENYNIQTLLNIVEEMYVSLEPEENRGGNDCEPPDASEKRDGWEPETEKIPSPQKEPPAMEKIKESGWKKWILYWFIFAAAGPLAVFLLYGWGGIEKYGWMLGAADLLLLIAGTAMWITFRKKGKRVDNAPKNTQRQAEIPEHWKLMFEEEEERRSNTSEEQKSFPPTANREMITEVLADYSSEEPEAYLMPEGGGEKITIDYVPFIIGKSADMADGCLNRSTVSRLHARIDCREGVYILTDLNSTNGTSVDGYKLEANETVSLKDGDRVVLADAAFHFVEKRW